MDGNKTLKKYLLWVCFYPVINRFLKTYITPGSLLFIPILSRGNSKINISWIPMGLALTAFGP